MPVIATVSLDAAPVQIDGIEITSFRSWLRRLEENPAVADREVGAGAVDVELTGSVLLTGAQRPAVGFRAQAIGFSDSRAGMQGRCVWTDERGDMVYSELKGEAVGSGNHIVGTFIGGTGRYRGMTGDYSFQWQYVIDAEEGAVSGRVVNFKGRARLSEAASAPARGPGA